MRTYDLSRVSDAALVRKLTVLLAEERISMAAVLALLAEVDARRLYLPAGFPSMYAYCVGELHLCEQAAMKHIRAARTARRFPVIFSAVADGRLHLSAVVLLTPHLTSANAAELVAAAAYQTKAEVQQLLARRFPKPDVPALLEAIAPPPLLGSATDQLSPGTVEGVAARLSPGTAIDGLAPAEVEVTMARGRVAPLSAERFALQVTIEKATHDKLRYAQALLSHQLPSGDIAQVVDRALDALIAELEKQKFAATARPRRHSCRSGLNPRYIPAHVKRAVWERDQGQCTFVGDTGRRCESRKFLEFDHVDPVARAGQATVQGLRLHCRGHNQLEAERTFGAGFMSAKREEARRAAAARTRAAAQARAHARPQQTELEPGARVAEAEACSLAAAQEQASDVMACLRELGFRASEARRAVDFCETIPAGTLEERVRAALKFLCPKPRFQSRVGTSLEART